MNSNCSNLSYLRNLQEQVKKAFCYQKLFWSFTVRTNCSSDLKIFSITRTIFSHNRSEQFLKQHTIYLLCLFLTFGGGLSRNEETTYFVKLPMHIDIKPNVWSLNGWQICFPYLPKPFMNFWVASLEMQCNFSPENT